MLRRHHDPDAPPSAHFYVNTAPYPTASQSGAASAIRAGLDGGRISAWCGKFRLPDADGELRFTVSFASTAAFCWRIALSPLLAQVLVSVIRQQPPFCWWRLKQLQQKTVNSPAAARALHMEVHGDNIALTSAGLQTD